jgi:hypothetical protein
MPRIIVEGLDPYASQQGADLGILPFQERSLRLREQVCAEHVLGDAIAPRDKIPGYSSQPRPRPDRRGSSR